MPTTFHIIKQAASITLSNRLLWLFGIFLSSGFNLHGWYGWQWMRAGRVGKSWTAWLAELPAMELLFMIFFLVVLWLLVVNFLKLSFLGLVHNHIHDLKQFECVLCRRLENQTLWRYLRSSRRLWLGAVSISAFTVVSTALVVFLFQFYSSHTDYNFLRAIIMLASLFLLLVFISWWNLFSVLYMMWHDQPLSRAASLAVDSISARLGSLLQTTVVATLLFLVAIAAGGTVLWQLPSLLVAPPGYLFSGQIAQAWQMVIAGLAAMLFLVWLVICNVWFNVVLIIWFNEHVKARKTGESVMSQILPEAALPTPFQHSVDKSGEIL